MSDPSTQTKLGKTPAWRVLHRFYQGLSINKLAFAGRPRQAVSKDSECPEIFLSNLNEAFANWRHWVARKEICFNRLFSPRRGSVRFLLLCMKHPSGAWRLSADVSGLDLAHVVRWKSSSLHQLQSWEDRWLRVGHVLVQKGYSEKENVRWT